MKIEKIGKFGVEAMFFYKNNILRTMRYKMVKK